MNLYKHQREGIAQAVQALKTKGGFFLCHDPGLGKTLSAILTARLLDVQKILVVTNTAGLGVWEREIQRWDPDASGAIIRADGGASWDPIFPKRVWRITNYDQLRDTTKEPYRNVAGFKADLVILDESQYIKSPSSQQQKAVSKLTWKAKRRLLLSGTPAHSPLDWWAQYRLVDPDEPLWNRTYTAYKQDIAIPHPTIQFAVKGFRPHVVAQAKEAMARVTHVARSEDVDVPEPTVTPIPVELHQTVRRAYNEMRDEMVAEFEQGALAAPIALVKFLRLHQITGGFVPLGETALPAPKVSIAPYYQGSVQRVQGDCTLISDAKLRVLADLLNERAGQKVMVACAFRPEIEAIANMIGYREGAEGTETAEYGRPGYALTITGDDSPEEKSRKEHLFQTSQHPIRLIVQYKAGGTALTLTAAHSLVIYSMQPSVIALRQMLGRVYRIGQTRHVQILPLLARNTVDEHLWDGLRDGLDAVDLAKYLKERL